MGAEEAENRSVEVALNLLLCRHITGKANALKPEIFHPLSQSYKRLSVTRECQRVAAWLRPFEERKGFEQFKNALVHFNSRQEEQVDWLAVQDAPFGRAL